MLRRLSHFLLLLAPSAALATGDDPNDPSSWTPVSIAGEQRAPEFAGIKAWINSRPLTMADLQGRVVLVHFLSVGSRNCVRDYPWYKGINKDFKDKGLVVIGIHTPETKEEENVATVQKEICAAGLTHPIAIDNQSTMWKRYFNQVSPSIYLFDKAGIARWGWRGELSWKGAQGKAHMRKKIEELLAQ
jgi:peroxiredoxin